MRKAMEKEEQRAVLEYLALKKWFAWKTNNAGIYKASTQSYIPAQTKGISDITAIKSGFVLFIEVKAYNGKQSEDQKIFEKNIRDHGGNYICGTSDYIIRELEELNI